MEAGKSVSRGISPQEQTMEGSTLLPSLLFLQFSDYDMVLHIIITIPGEFPNLSKWPCHAQFLVHTNEHISMQISSRHNWFNIMANSFSSTMTILTSVMPRMMWHIHIMSMCALLLLYLCSAVSDADGDIVRCRWAESAQGECAGVCQAFPATLDQVC